MQRVIRTLFLGLCGVVAATSLPLFSAAEDESAEVVNVVVIFTTGENGQEVPVQLGAFALDADLEFTDGQLERLGRAANVGDGYDSDGGEDRTPTLGKYTEGYRASCKDALAALPLSDRVDVNGVSALDYSKAYVTRFLTVEGAGAEVREVPLEELELHFSTYGGEAVERALRRTAQVSHQEVGALKILVTLTHDAFIRLSKTVQDTRIQAADRFGRIAERLKALTNHVNGILTSLADARERLAAEEARGEGRDRRLDNLDGRLTNLERGFGGFISFFGWACRGLLYGAQWLGGYAQDGNRYYVYPSLRDISLGAGVGGWTSIQVVLNIPWIGPLLRSKIPCMRQAPIVIMIVSVSGALLHTFWYRESDDTITWTEQSGDREVTRTAHRTDITASIFRKVDPRSRRRRIQQTGDEQV